MAGNQVDIRVVASGAEEAARILQSVGAAGGRIGSVTASGANEAERALHGLGSTAKDVFAIFTGFTIGSLFVQAIERTKEFAGEIAKLGLEAKVQEDAFARLSKSVGVAGEALVSEMNKAAGGILNTSDVMIAAAKALNQSLQPEQIVNLMTIARQQSKLAGVDVSTAFNDITNAIANQQPRALKQLGIVVDLDAAFKQHAATLGVEVQQLSELGKTQAIYNAVSEQTKNSVAALSGEALTQSEQIQKMSGAWKQVKEDMGKALIDAGFAVLDWVKEMQARLPDMSDAAAQMGAIWSGVWENIKIGMETIGESLVSVIIPSLKLGLAAAAAFGVGLNAAFSAAVGPATYLASIIGDLASKKWPDFNRATLEANVATANARVRLAESVDAFGKLAAGTTDAGKATKEMAASTEMGTNKLGALSNQIKPLVPDLKAMAAAVAGVAQAFKALSDEAARGVFPETDAEKLNAPLDAMRDKLREQAAAAGISKAAIQQLDAVLAKYQTTLVNQVQASRDAMAESKKDLDVLRDGWESGAKSVEAMEFSYDKWIASINANGALDEADAFYTALPNKIMASAQAYESVQTPLDDAARSAVAFQDSLAAIGREAALMGPAFDEASAKLQAFKSRILELQAIEHPTGAILDELEQLKASFADTRDFIKLRDVFTDIFGSVQGGVAKMIEGLQLGTRSWASFGKTALDVLKSITAEIINRLIKAGLDPLFARLASAASAAFSGGTSFGGGEGGAGGIGTSDIIREGGGGGGFTVPSGASSVVGFFDPSRWSTLSSIWDGLATGWEAGEGVVSGFTGAVSGAWDAATLAAGSVSTLSTAVAGVGAAVAAFSSVMDIVNGKVESGVGGLVGGVALGAVGAYFAGPFGAALGYGIGDLLGSWIGGMFGGPSNYELKRIQAADAANAALGNVTGGYQAALNSGSLAQVLAALQGGGGGASNNSVRTELVLPTSIAQRIGLTGQQIGDELVTQWRDVTLDQFEKVIAAFREQPDLIQGIRGSGDVPFLEGGDAAAIADQIQKGAVSLVTAFEAMETVKDKITTLASDLGTIGKDILPPDLADKFSHGLVDPIRDRMLAVLSSGLPIKELQKQFDALEKELQSYVGLVSLYGQVNQDMAQLSGDFATQTEGAITGIRAALTAADRAVENATSAAGRAVGPEAELQAQTALRNAIIGRYQMEIDMVRKIEAAIAQLLVKQAAVTQTLTQLAVADLSRGDATAFNEVYLALADMAMVAPTVAQRLYAVGAGIAAVLAALPTTVRSFGNVNAYDVNTPGGGEITAAIIAQVRANVAPFFTSLGDMIRDAAEAGDMEGELALLEKQADLIKQVGAALVQAVNEWAAAASAGARTKAGEMASDINKNWDAFAEASHTIAAAAKEDITKNWDAFAEASQVAADALRADIIKNWDTLRKNVTDAANAAIQGEQDKISAIELATTARQKAIDAEVKGIDQATKAQQKALGAQMDGIDQATKAQQKALDMEMDAIAAATKARQEQIAAEIEGLSARQEAIQAERQALQEQIAAARQWEDAAKSVGEFITQLKLGGQSNLNPAAQLTLASDTFAALKAQFAAAPTVDLARELQQAGGALLTAGSRVFSEPSPKYVKLFDDVVKEMELVRGTAAGMAPVSSSDLEAQTAELERQSEAIADEIEALRKQSQAIGNASANQIAALRTQSQAIGEATNAQIAALRAQSQVIGEDAAARIDLLREESAALNETAKAQIDVLRGGIETIRGLLSAELERIAGAKGADLEAVAAWLKVRTEEIREGRAYDLAQVDAWLKVRDEEIKAGREYDLGVVHVWLVAQLAAIEASRAAAEASVTTATATALRENAARQREILGALTNGQTQQLNTITEGMDVQTFIAAKQREAVNLLGLIALDLHTFLMGEGHARGLAYVPRTGPYKIHEGERILTREERLAYERGLTPSGGGSGAVTLTVNLTVNGGSGTPTEIASAVQRALRPLVEDVLRSPKGRVMIQEAAK
jgi:hypothetical protein